MLPRQHTIANWLKEILGPLPYQISSLAGDASFRRYYRISLDRQSFVLMDAEQEKKSLPPFIAIANALTLNDVMTPNIYAANHEEGLLLLTDFGDQLLLHTLTTQNAEALYQKTIQELVKIQKCQNVLNWPIPIFSREIMLNELFLFREWFLEGYLKLSLTDKDNSLLEKVFHFLVDEIVKQPYVFMHRDYHSANIMVLPDQQLGILDFQDAFFGPITYDLASLLRDCYIEWPDNLIKKLTLSFHKSIRTPIAEEEFLKMFDVMGLQRHLKALLTFSRKYVRDHNSNYLQHIPRTLNYILKIADSYPETIALSNFLKEKIPEKIKCAG